MHTRRFRGREFNSCGTQTLLRLERLRNGPFQILTYGCEMQQQAGVRKEGQTLLPAGVCTPPDTAATAAAAAARLRRRCCW